MNNSFTVVASANSRLHADVILIRLRRAQMDCRKISVLFPTQAMPNAVGCWLPIARDAKLKVGEENIGCAGQLGKELASTAHPHGDGREVAGLLTHSGVDAMGAHVLVERLGQGHILLCVHASSEVEASIAWHVFRHSCVDTIILDAMPTRASARHYREVQETTPWVPIAA